MKKLVSALALLPGLAMAQYNTSLTAPSPPCFSTTNYSVTNSSNSGNRSIVAADFNNDGKIDIISTGAPTNGLQLLLGNGVGGFAPFTVPDTTTSRSIVSADFNNDGKADIAASTSQNFVVRVIFGNGNGTFTLGNTYPAATSLLGYLYTADLNGDNYPDLVSTNGGGSPGVMSVLLNNGSGGFNPATNYFLADNPSTICAGDFDTDGKKDLAVYISGGNGTQDSVAVLFGTGSGSFGTAKYFHVGVGPFGFTGCGGVGSGDLNADGFDDLVVASANCSYTSVFLSKGAQKDFFSATNYNVPGTLSLSVQCGDYNNDAKKDLAICHYNAAAVSVFCGNGNGTFVTGYSFNTDPDAFELISADFNADGKPDLATPNLVNTNSVLLNCFTNSIQEQTSMNSALISPNPAREKFSVLVNLSDEIELSIFDMQGRYILSKKNFSGEDIDVSQMQNGIYTITLKSGHLSVNKKLVVAH